MNKFFGNAEADAGLLAGFEDNGGITPETDKRAVLVRTLAHLELLRLCVVDNYTPGAVQSPVTDMFDDVRGAILRLQLKAAGTLETDADAYEAQETALFAEAEALAARYLEGNEANQGGQA